MQDLSIFTKRSRKIIPTSAKSDYHVDCSPLVRHCQSLQVRANEWHSVVGVARALNIASESFDRYFLPSFFSIEYRDTRDVPSFLGAKIVSFMRARGRPNDVIGKRERREVQIRGTRGWPGNERIISKSNCIKLAIIIGPEMFVRVNPFIGNSIISPREYYVNL